MRINLGSVIFTAVLCVCIMSCTSIEAFAAATIWTKASEIMKDVYNQILLISTIAAVVTASVALLLMNFSKSGKTVDESRAWLKRIAITWAILNGLGFIIAYCVRSLPECCNVLKSVANLYLRKQIIFERNL